MFQVGTQSVLLTAAPLISDYITTPQDKQLWIQLWTWVFDNNYYLDLQNNETLFTSDQTLYSNSADTEDIVDSFASNQTVFFENFILGMLKMGQLDVLTGSEGEIRTNCSIANTDSSYYQQIIESIVGPEEQSQSSQST